MQAAAQQRAQTELNDGGFDRVAEARQPRAAAGAGDDIRFLHDLGGACGRKIACTPTPWRIARRPGRSTRAAPARGAPAIRSTAGTGPGTNRTATRRAARGHWRPPAPAAGPSPAAGSRRRRWRRRPPIAGTKTRAETGAAEAVARRILAGPTPRSRRTRRPGAW